MNKSITEFMRTCVGIDWFNVAAIDRLNIPSMFIVAVAESSEPDKVIGKFNHFFLENERYAAWKVVQFNDRFLTVGRS